MKKHWLFTMLLAMVLCVLCIALFSAEAKAASVDDLTFTLSNDGESYSVNNCDDYASGELTIPATYNGKPVASIGARAFSGCAGLTSITIPDSVTSIGDGAFSYCDRLRSITIPDSVTSIGENAFYSSTIRKLIIAEGSNEITSTMVISKHTLQEVVIPGSVTTIGDEAFSYCTNLTSITIPDSVTTIGTYAFRVCLNLSSIAIPDSVAAIGKYAFSNCYNLTSATIGNGVTSIGNSAFSECTGLTDVYITDPNAWCNISFSNDYANPMYYAGFLHILDAEGNEVTDITLDNTVTTIPAYRFKNCKYLTSIMIPDSVTSVGSYAFDGCTIQKLMIAEGSKTITWSMVISKQTLQEVVIPDSVTSISNDAFYGCTKLTSIKIPDSVTTIGREAFAGCTGLTRMTIGSGVTSIGSAAFEGCSALTDVYITDPSAWCKISFADDYANPMAYASCLHILDANGMEATDITFDDTITTIPANRFKNCKHVTTLTVSDKLTSIGNSAFYGCTIRKLIIAEGVKTINEAMIVCRGTLQEIVIPDSVTSIDDFAFSSCSNLTNITLKDGITKIGKGAFYYCDSLTEINIPDSVTSIGTLAFYECSNLTNVTIGDSVTKIGEQAFKGCTSLTNITIPDSITSIDDAAFYDCPNLNYNTYNNAEYLGNANNPYVALVKAGSDITSCTIHNDTKVIAAGAFQNCDYLVSVVIPDGVVGVGTYAFEGCYDLISVSIPDSVTSIGAYAFRSCRNLSNLQLSENNPYYSLDCSGVLFNKDKTELIFASAASTSSTYVMPDSVKRIDAYAFFSCDRLYSIAMPKSVTYIGESAFDWCYSLKHIWYGGYSANNINGDLPTGVTWHLYYCGSDSHKYDYVCDDACRSCRFPRDASHVYDNADDVTCNFCKQTLAPAAPSYRGALVTGTTVTLPAIEGYEYSMDAKTWQQSNVFTGLTPATTYKFYQRVAAGVDNLASPASSPTSITTNKYAANAPNAPVVESKTSTSVTLQSQPGCEYSVDGKIWQASNLFTGLSAETEYTFFQRIAETDDNYASPSSHSVVVTTLRAFTVTYDVLGGSNAPAAQTKDQGIDLVLSGTAPRHSSYMFAGWSTTPYGEVAYRCGDTYKKDENVTLYAVWVLRCTTCNGERYTLVDCALCNGTGVWAGMVSTCCRDRTAYVQVTHGSSYYKCRSCGKVCDVVSGVADCEKTQKSICEPCYGRGYLKRQAGAPVRPELLSATSTCITVVPKPELEYSIDGKTWQASNIFEGLTPNTQYKIYQRYKENAYFSVGTISLSLQVTTSKNTQSTPAAPSLSSKTANKIVLVAVPGYEYSKDGVTWQQENVFEDLEPATEYVFYQRKSEDDQNFASASSAGLRVVTDELQYTVVFKNWDGSVISAKSYHYGDEIIVPASPTKAADNTYTYPFAGWHNEVVNCAGDATYIATYTPTYINYTVVFKDWNGDVLSTETYHWGDEIVVPANPTRVADNIYTYTFKGWDNEVVSCAGDATYTATYTPTYIKYAVVFKNWNGDVLSTETYHWGDQVIAPADPIRESDNTYTYSFSGWDRAVANCAGNATYTATFKAAYIDYIVVFKNWDDTVISSKTYHWGDVVEQPQTPVREQDRYYTYSFSGWDTEVVSCAGNAAYKATYAAKLIPAKITSQPKTQKIKSGATAKFIVEADGIGLTYQWQSSSNGKTWKNCSSSSATKATFSFTSKTSHNGNYYRCKVTDGEGNVVYTSAVRLYVLGVTTQPKTQKVEAGDKIKLTVGATGDGLKYQWQSSTNGKTWKNCSSSSATKATFSFTSKTSHSSNYYRCVITDSDGNKVYTDAVRLYVLSVTTQPKTQKVEAGEKVKFSVTATGAGKTYQWQSSTDGKTWKNCSSSSATKATFNFTSKTSHSGNYYRCRIKDNAGNTVYTDAVRLYVLGITEQPISKTVTKGKTAKFAVEATGASKTYQWQVSTDGGKTWKNCSSSSAKKATFTFTSKTTHNGNYYRCRITDSAKNSMYTNKVKLTVKK